MHVAEKKYQSISRAVSEQMPHLKVVVVPGELLLEVTPPYCWRLWEYADGRFSQLFHGSYYQMPLKETRKLISGALLIEFNGKLHIIK